MDDRLEFGLQTDAKEATSAFKELEKTVSGIISLLNSDKLNNKKFSQAVNTINKLNNVSTTRLQNSLKALDDAMNKTNSVFQKNVFGNFTNQLNNAYNAVGNLKKLLRKLSTVDTSSISNLNLVPLINQIERFGNMNEAVSNFSATTETMNRFITVANRFSKVSIPETLISEESLQQISKLKNVVTEINNSFEGLKIELMESAISIMQRLPKAMQAMQNLDVSKIGQTFDTIKQKLQEFLAVLREGSADIQAFSDILTRLSRTNFAGTGSASNITTQLNNISQQVRDIGTQATKTSKSLSSMLSFGRLYAFYNQLRHFGSSFMNMLNQSLDFAETENLFSRAMGNMRAEAMQFQEDLAEMFGTAMPSMMQAQATFKNMIGVLGGLTDQQSYDLSERVTEMALDYSSLYNTTIDSALTKFQAALSKQVSYCPLYLGEYSEFLLIAGSLNTICAW